MSEKCRRKRLTGLALTAAACVAIVVSGTLLGGRGEAKILDSEGREIGQFFLNDGNLEYECSTGCEAYVDVVRNELFDIVIEKENLAGKNEEKSVAKKILSENMEIRTAFSAEALKALTSAYAANADAAIGNSAAAVCDSSGRLIACTSVSKSADNYNYVTIPAYGGSAVKPLSVYAPALEDKIITWSSMYKDSPYAMAENESGQLEEWPANTEPYTNRMIPVEEAVSTSNNAIAVKVLKKYGAEKAAMLLEQEFGIPTGKEMEALQTKGDDRVLGNLALGYLEDGVTVEQMAAAYQIFSNGGTFDPAHAVLEISVDGKSYYQYEEQKRRVLSEQTAYITNRLLRTVVLEGTGTAAQIDGVDVCGKTGTSEYGDHWFAGVTPEYTCAVWYEETSESGTTERSVRIFKDTMEALSAGEQSDYVKPEGIREAEYCKKSGLLAGSKCKETGNGFYIEGNMPGKCNKCD